MNRNDNDFINKISDFIGSDKFRNFKDNLKNLLSETDFPPIDEDETYSLITDNYFRLIKKLKIGKISTFSFSDYNDPHIIVVDGRKYDFDSLFSHNDSTASEYLCEIDALMADINKDETVVLKEIEKRMNR